MNSQGKESVEKTQVEGDQEDDNDDEGDGGGVSLTHQPGITYVKDKNMWRARVGLGGSRVHLGYFNSEEEAIEAYAEAKKEYSERKSSMDVIAPIGPVRIRKAKVDLFIAGADEETRTSRAKKTKRLLGNRDSLSSTTSSMSSSSSSINSKLSPYTTAPSTTTTTTAAAAATINAIEHYPQPFVAAPTIRYYTPAYYVAAPPPAPVYYHHVPTHHHFTSHLNNHDDTKSKSSLLPNYRISISDLVNHSHSEFINSLSEYQRQFEAILHRQSKRKGAINLANYYSS